MNSQSFREIQESLIKTPNAKAEEVKRKEDIALEKGDLIESLLRHEGWKLIKSQLEEVKLRLQEELADSSRCDTLKKIQQRQYLITAIELFINSPKQFLEKRNQILSRREQWQNKRP